MTTQKPWEGKVYQGCASCPPVERIAPLDMTIAVGFGMACVTKNGTPVYVESYLEDGEDFWTTADAEQAAEEDPDADWLIIMEAPLRGRTYQRQGKRKWVLIESNSGFA